MISEIKEKVYLEVNGEKVFGILNAPEHEEGEKMPIVIMMHGIKMSTGQYPYFELMKMFGKRKIATFRFDFYGHGRSEGEFERYLLSKGVEDAEAAINYVKGLDFVSDIMMLGHSMGANIAIIKASEHPDIIKHLILLAPATVLYTMKERGVSFGMKIDFDNLPDRIVYNEDFILRKEYFLQLKNYNYNELAKDFPGKVCIIIGEHDERIPLPYAEELNSKYPNSELNVIKDGTHMLNDCGEEVVSLAKKFIEKIY